jgi:glycosyltransferase involved in cell wall biosynthesis
VNAVNDYLRMAFPPHLPNIQHAVINSEAREQLALRTGITSVIVPNVLDFEAPPRIDAAGTRRFRASLDLRPEDIIILQPTRIVRRKGIEHAIELVKALNDPRYKLVISHEAGDEGFDYAEWLKDYACEHRVDLRLVATHIADPWHGAEQAGNALSLWDVYPHADFITYPSLYEGFGNAFLEAIYFSKPLLVNRYATFVRDIEPLGFDLAVMDGYLSKQTVRFVRDLLSSRERRQQMVDTNYAIAARHYSYGRLREQLNLMLAALFGKSAATLVKRVADAETGEGLTFAPTQVAFKRFSNRNCTGSAGQ